MAQHVAFDESGKGADSRHVVFAGFFASPDQWVKLQRKWDSVLRVAGIDPPYFRAVEAFTFGGLFQRFGGNDLQKERQRDDVIRALTDVGCEFAAHGTGATVVTADF